MMPNLLLETGETREGKKRKRETEEEGENRTTKTRRQIHDS